MLVVAQIVDGRSRVLRTIEQSSRIVETSLVNSHALIVGGQGLIQTSTILNEDAAFFDHVLEGTRSIAHAQRAADPSVFFDHALDKIAAAGELVQSDQIVNESELQDSAIFKYGIGIDSANVEENSVAA